MITSILARKALPVSAANVRQFSSTAAQTIGVIGLGNMGQAVAANLVKAGNSVVAFDVDDKACSIAENAGAQVESSASDVASKTSVLLTILPNDKILKHVVSNDQGPNLLTKMNPGALHISCSTISPDTSRELSNLHETHGSRYVAAPIFARPDGMAALQGSFVVSGKQESVADALKVLNQTASGCFEFGEDPGAANVVKISGNFLISSAINAMAEACALLEANGVSRVDAIKFYSSTFLSCPIYQGYGQRVSERDHRPGGFALEWGLKDVTLARGLAHQSNTPMPFLSVLVDQYLSENAKGRSDLDWSAIALGVSERCGVDVSDAVARARGN